MRQDVVIRGTTKTGLIVLLPDEMDFGEICQKLWNRLSQAGHFFKGSEVTVHVPRSALSETDQELIASILGQFDMSLKQVVVAPDPVSQVQAAVKAAERSRRSSVPAASLLRESETALVVTRTLRSGQSIRHQGDVIVLGDVNPGSEIIATGHIVVMGALRGVAHAGAGGNTAAFVAATKLRPMQLRIAQHIGLAPDNPDEGQPVPEVARVHNGIIVVEAPADSKR